ncbi:putative NEP-interacting protein [Thalictrum thalictroides]|uniref:Putative NEP-interacting protein n=1 Tax=Thalictrum thalictroides TaxID=46969 RepID=A0A7J6X1P0_THATH|nr:putative NEP-interacting protein [Thalictrum thalictroides]
MPQNLINEDSMSRSLSIMQKNMNCRQGTVPIRRISKENLVTAKSFLQTNLTNVHLLTKASPGMHAAYLKPPNGALYFGARAHFNVHSLSVKADQFTTSQLWIENGPPDQRNSLQAGWMVNEKINGDNATRLYAYWKVDNSKTGCFNTLCPGFVQVSPGYGVGSQLIPVSTSDNPRYIDITVFQDTVTKHWWLAVRRGKKVLNIGYWPKEILSQMVGGASFVAWGGLAVGPPNGISPPMGNGHLPVKNDLSSGCYIDNLQVLFDASGRYFSPDKDHMEIYVDNQNCYGLQYFGHIVDKDFYFIKYDRGLVFLFGGPGGNNCGV